MKTFNQLLAGIILSVSAFTTFANELGNPGFEDNTSSHIYGNNFSPNISPWTAVGPPNVVQVDGPGGATWYDVGRPIALGPQSDASGISGVRHYLDMKDDVGSIYQAFTTPEECSGEVRFGGFFSTRGNAAGEAHVEIREGTGMSGNLVGTTTVVNIPVLTNSAVDPWTPVNFTATLSAGTTYSFVIWMDNQLNFDEAYVNFVDGPCKDDSDLDEEESKQCLVLEPKVECVANKWQVSITNSSTSFNADVLEVTSLTSGVTISGSSPNWILNGALPNSSVDITVDGTVTGGGKEDFADLCCTTKLHIDIPDETCEIVQKKPHIYTKKAYVETEEGKGEFRFVLDSWVQLNDPMTLTITDTIPAGVTLTSLDSANTTNWSCPGLPVAGPGTLVCTYIGAMPILAGTNFNVLVYADVESSTEDRKNCIKTNLVDTDTNQIPYDGNDGSCINIPPEEVIDDKEPEIKTEKVCELAPKFGPYQQFTCKITVTASNLSGGGTISLSDTIMNSGGTLINATSSTENWQCDPTPSSTSPFDCSLTEAELISAGGTSVIYISGMAEETLKNCANSSYTNGVGEVSSEACWNVVNDDDGGSNNDDTPQFTLEKTFTNEMGHGVPIQGFLLMLKASSPINAPNIIQLTDTLPAGVTLNAVFGASVAHWSCPGLPITGPSTLTCTYIGPMPFTESGLMLTANVVPTDELRQNCSGVQVLTDEGATPQVLDSQPEHCADIPPNMPTPCRATVEEPNACLVINKVIVSDSCVAGGACKYGLSITNTSDQPYTSPLNIQESFTPVLSSVITVTSVGSAPDPMCSGASLTSMPFSCVQSTDLPAFTTWQYLLSTTNPDGVTENCLQVNDKKVCVNIPADESSDEICEAPMAILYGHCVLPCQNNGDCPTATGEQCLPYGESLVCQTPPSDVQTMEIDKFAPKTCKAGSKCEFTFTITNNTKKSYSGFIGVVDKPKKRFGRIRGKSKDWSCKKKGREYRCGIDKLVLKAGEKRKMTLTLQVPSSLSGKVENCATLEAQMPVGTPASPKSCVTVNIINNRECGYDDKRVNGKCVPRCKSKKSHWNGIDCMVCSSSKIWNDKVKRCDKKPKKVIKSCPPHYKWSASKKRCIYVVVDSITKIPNCNKGTHYDAGRKRCVENKVKPPSCSKHQRWDSRVRKCVSTLPPKCNKGTHYDAGKKRCVENKRSHPKGCPAGQIYLSDIKRCVKVKKEHPKGGGGGGCGGGEIWNIIYKKCEKLPEYEGNDDGGHTGGGGDHP